MVRLKERYLLIQILYPTHLPVSSPSNPTSNQKLTPSPSTLLHPKASPTTPTLLALYSPTPDAINAGTVIRLLRTQIATLFGEHGAAVTSAGLHVKYWSNATSCFVVRCRRDVVRMVWAAVSFVTGMPLASTTAAAAAAAAAAGSGDREGKYGGGDGRRGGRGGAGSKALETPKVIECVWRVVHVSGTVRKCEEEAVRRSKGILGRMKGLKEAESAGVDVERLMGVAKGDFDGGTGGHGEEMDVDDGGDGAG